MLDVAAPLLQLKTLSEQGDDRGSRNPGNIIDDAIKLLENAISNASTIRRKRVLKACNQHIQGLAEEETLFREAAPNLFGPSFEKKMKDRAESVKILAKSQLQSARRFFSRGHTEILQLEAGPSSLSDRRLATKLGECEGICLPTWNLIGRTVSKVQRESVKILLLIAPVWPTQPWYPGLLALLVDYPRLIPQQDMLQSQHFWK